MKHSVLPLSDTLQTGLSTFTNSLLQEGAAQQTLILGTFISFSSSEPPVAQLSVQAIPPWCHRFISRALPDQTVELIHPTTPPPLSPSCTHSLPFYTGTCQEFKVQPETPHRSRRPYCGIK